MKEREKREKEGLPFKMRNIAILRNIKGYVKNFHIMFFPSREFNELNTVWEKGFVHLKLLCMDTVKGLFDNRKPKGSHK